MPTKRTWRERQGVEFLSAYQASELLTGEIDYPVMGYDGYGDGVGQELTDFINPMMRADWTTHRTALLSFWISGRWSSELPNTLPWIFYRGAPGTRPWAWWELEKHHPRIRDDENEDEYLTRTQQWLPGERDLFEAAEREPEPDDDDADLTDR